VTSREAAKVERWRLDSVALTDFRGIVGTTEYRFAALPALVWGENGVGKSTLALGLEWSRSPVAATTPIYLPFLVWPVAA
jgi:hypothetical protein